MTYSITMQNDGATVMQDDMVILTCSDQDEALDYIRDQVGTSIEVEVTELDGYITIAVT